MSFLSPSTPDLTTGATRSAHDPGGPLPVAWGWTRHQVKWVDHPWNVKVHGHGTRRPNSKSASLIGLVCAGPVDLLLPRMIINGKSAFMGGGWPMAKRSDGGDYHESTIAWDRFTMRFRFYWGKVDQDRDAWVLSEGRDHPAYPGICYVVFEDLNYDTGPNEAQGRGSVPNIEFLVWRSTSLGGEMGDDDPETEAVGVNPLGPVYDLLHDPVFGAGIPDTILDQTLWQNQFNALESAGYHWWNDDWGFPMANGNVSPSLGETRSIRDHMVDLFGLFGGFVNTDTDGKIVPGWYPNRNYNPGGIATIDRAVCLEEPEVELDSRRVYDKVTVTYRELDEDTWGDGSEETASARNPTAVTVRNPALRGAAGGEIRALDVEEPAINNRFAAHAYATRLLRSSVLAATSLRVPLSRTNAEHSGSPIRPGDIVWFNNTPLGLNTLMRVGERHDEGGERVILVLHSEPLFTENEVNDPEDPRTPPPVQSPEALVAARSWETPVAFLAGDTDQAVSILAGRSDLLTSWMEVYWSKTGDFTGEESPLDPIFEFAAPVNVIDVASDYSWVEFTFEHPDGLPMTSRGFTDEEEEGSYMLLVVEDAALSLGDLIESSGTGPWTRKYACSFAAASFAPTFSAPEPGHLIARSNLPTFIRPDFIESGYFRLVPRTFFESGTPVDIAKPAPHDIPGVKDVRITNADEGGYQWDSVDPGFLWPSEAAVDAEIADNSENRHPIKLEDKARMVLSWPSGGTSRWAPDGYAIAIWNAVDDGTPWDQQEWYNLTIQRRGMDAQRTLFDLPRAGWYWVIVQAVYRGRLSRTLDAPQGWVYTDTGTLTEVESEVLAVDEKVENLTFSSLTNAPEISGQGGKIVAVASSGDELELIDPPSGAESFIDLDDVNVSSTSSQRSRKLLYYDDNGTNIRTAYGTAGSSYHVPMLHVTNATGDRDMMEFRRGVGSTGDLAGKIITQESEGVYSVLFAQPSDHRLKFELGPIDNAIATLRQLKPLSYSWAKGGSRQQGFLAHEVQAVVPQAVSGEKDDVDDKGQPKLQMLDHAKLVPLLTAALQEAVQRLDDIERRLED